jgi:hypothetical protein
MVAITAVIVIATAIDSSSADSIAIVKPGQVVTLNWQETIRDAGQPLAQFRLTSFEIDSQGWRASISLKNVSPRTHIFEQVGFIVGKGIPVSVPFVHGFFDFGRVYGNHRLAPFNHWNHRLPANGTWQGVVRSGWNHNVLDRDIRNIGTRTYVRFVIGPIYGIPMTSKRQFPWFSTGENNEQFSPIEWDAVLTRHVIALRLAR